MNLFEVQRRHSRRPRLIGQQGKLWLADILTAIGLVALAIFAFTLLGLIDRKPDHVLVRPCGSLEACMTAAEARR